MGRLAMAGALISVALGSALAFPVAAQAATSAPAAGISRAAVPDLSPGGQWQLSGTYPNAAACNAAGVHLVETYRTDQSYACHGDQLWIFFVNGVSTVL
jgi:hypothetical protein